VRSSYRAASDPGRARTRIVVSWSTRDSLIARIAATTPSLDDTRHERPKCHVDPGIQQHALLKLFCGGSRSAAYSRSGWQWRNLTHLFVFYRLRAGHTARPERLDFDGSKTVVERDISTLRIEMAKRGSQWGRERSAGVLAGTTFCQAAVDTETFNCCDRS